MATAKIVYASMTGNTEECANIVFDKLEELGLTVEIDEATSVEATDLENYDLVIAGPYTYGDGDLPDEMIDLYEDLTDVDLAGKIYGCFGSGDTFYDDLYCKSVKDFDEKLAMTGATKGAENVYVDLSPEENDIVALEAFATELAAKVQ